MKSEEFKQRREEARTAKSCLDWHKYCKAECCKTVFLNVSPEELEEKGSFISIHEKIDFDEMRYFKLRGVRYVHGALRFPKSKCISLGGGVIYVNRCELLDGYLCKGHPDRKPNLCKALTLESAQKPNQGFRVTDNCLFKYKEVGNNENQDKD